MASRLLTLIGSGEMTRGMVGLHAELMSRVGSPPAPAVFLDTPYGFQENADEISGKARAYFSDRVGHPIDVVSLRDAEAADPLALERAYSAIRGAAYVFAGPGSPSYALRQWRRTRVPQLLEDRLAEGGGLTFASAAAIAIGEYALPVYEIYKVGERPHWVDGLDLLRPLGLDFVVIPHYDNAEGGTHDTRYCYMGERRLRELERQLPFGTAILGIAEHTVAIIDLDAQTVEVRGRGFVAVREAGWERRFQPGTAFPMSKLRDAAPVRVVVRAPQQDRPAPDPLIEVSRRQRSAFERALADSDADGALRALLELEDQLADSRSEASEGFDGARSIFRDMLVQLGQVIHRREPDPEQVVAPFVELALRMRDEARRERRYSEADQVRDALADLQVEVRDTPTGTDWSLNGRNGAAIN